MNRSLPNETLELKPFRKEFRSCLSELASMRGFVAQTLANFMLATKIQEEVTIAIDEAFTNIIRHGYGDCNEFDIQIGLSIKGSDLNISIFDRGTSFDINKHPELDLNKHLSTYKKGGLGIHIIRQLVDDIRYHPAENRGEENRLVLIKHISG